MTAQLACALAIVASAAPADDPTRAVDDAEQLEAADATQPSRVLLISTRGDQAATEDDATRARRVRAELEAAGFAVLEVGLTISPDQIDSARLAELADEHDATAVVITYPGLSYARLWTTVRTDGDDPASAAPQLRAVVVGEKEGGPDDGVVFAVRVAEVLEATLIRVEAQREDPPPEPPPAPPPEAKPPPEPAPPPSPEPPRWGVRAGLHGMGTNENLGFMLAPNLGAMVALGPRRRVGLDIDALATALPGRVRGTEGQATVGLVGVRALAQWWPVPTARVSPGLGLGWGMLVAWTQGRGAGPVDGRIDVAVVSTPVGGADLAIALAKQVRLRIGARVSVALPAIRVAVDGRFVRTAQPIADGGLAIEIVGPWRR